MTTTKISAIDAEEVANLITFNEADVLNGIAYHEYNVGNGAAPECAEDVSTYCWAGDFSATLTINQVKGVLSSLVKKELIVIQDNGVNDGGVKETLVDFTKAGFEVWQEHRSFSKIIRFPLF